MGDEINARYAYARGHEGEGIIVSSMDSAVNYIHPAFDDGQLVTGFKAIGGIANGENGICRREAIGPSSVGTDNCLEERYQGTHLAGIIAGKEGARPQGVAYKAQIKPIDIDLNEGGIVTGSQLVAAIQAASGPTITVMNNGWNRYFTSSYDEDDDPDTTDDSYFYQTRGPSILPNERMAWVEAVKTTVVVFARGDSGFNSENGEIKLYDNSGLTGDVIKTALWEDVAPAGKVGNIGLPHSEFPTAIGDDSLMGSWLSVIAVQDSEPVAGDATKKTVHIAPFSNGCGVTKEYCIAAPGVRIFSASLTATGIREESGTAQAAAVVSGAVAVVASSLPPVVAGTMTIEEARAQRVKDIVEIILTTADDIGIAGTDNIYGRGLLNLAKATEPIGPPTMMSFGNQRLEGVRIDNSGITLPTSFGTSLTGFTAGFTDDYDRAFVGSPSRITQANAAFTLADTFATWETPELQSIALDSNSKMQFINDADAKDTLIFTHNNANHTIGFSYNEESKTPDLSLNDKGEELHFQKIRPIASDLMQVNSTHKLGGKFSVKNSITTGEFDTGNRFNEAMANLNYAGENHKLTIGAGNLQEYGQFLGASGTGAYQLSDATQSTVTHIAVTQNLPLNSSVKLKYTNFKTEVDMRYDNFANINDLTANEYQLAFAKQKILGKNDSIDFELIQPFAVTDGKLQQSTVLGYNAEGGYNNVVQNYDLTPAKRHQQIRMTWQNQVNRKNETKLFISMQYENHIDNLRDKEESSILGGISTRF